MQRIAEPASVATAEALGPLIASHADAAEALRRLPDELVEAFVEARLFQIYVPKELGGDEVDYVESIRILETLARADGAAAWNVMIGSGNGRYAAVADPVLAGEMYTDPKAVWAASFPPTGRLSASDGGFRLSGRWTYCSGCQQSGWFLAGCMVNDGEHARRGPDGRPVMFIAAVPREDFRIIETWDTAGMRGTGSNDIVVDDAFVPGYRTFSLSASPRIDRALYRIPQFAALGPGVAAVSLGIARHAIDGFIEFAQGKRHSVTNVLARDRVVAQMRVAEAEGVLRAARAYYYEATTGAWEAAKANRVLSIKERALLRIACVTAAQSAARAVDLIFSISGSSAIQVSGPIERCWRDVHTASTHATVAESNLEPAGRILLGLDAGPGALL